jgi:predicted amidohydrolase YtcJ
VLIRDAEVGGRRVDVRVGDQVEAIGALTPSAGEDIVDAAGGALLPGLHDHHVHILSLAASLVSVRLEDVATAPVGDDGWVRVVGWDGSVDLDRERLDGLRMDTPVRVQHRSGQLWVVNTAGLAGLGLDPGSDGRLYRQDARLRCRLPAVMPDVARVGRLLAGFGVTGVTDATVSNGPVEAALIATLTQRVVVMNVTAGAPRKLVLAEADLPALADFAAAVAAAHAAGRPAAVHAVTRAELVLALAVVAAGDRVEHAGVCPPELAVMLVERGVTVVTQPHFPVERAAQYTADVDVDDQPWLYPCALLVAHGVPLGAGTDAPFADPDPWKVIAAAIARGLPPARALALFLTPADTPGGAVRRVAAGVPADLCLLHVGLRDALAAPSAALVRATWVAGVLLER